MGRGGDIHRVPGSHFLVLGQPLLKPLAHALDEVLEHVDVAGQLLGAAQGVVGDGVDDLVHPGVDLFQFAGEDQVRLTDRVQFLAQGAGLCGPFDEAVEGEAHRQGGDERRQARTPAAAIPPNQQGDDHGQAKIGAG